MRSMALGGTTHSEMERVRSRVAAQLMQILHTFELPEFSG
jgi:hypothetical protein